MRLHTALLILVNIVFAQPNGYGKDLEYLRAIHAGEEFSYASPVSLLVPGGTAYQPVTDLDWLALAPAMLDTDNPVRWAVSLNTESYPAHTDPGLSEQASRWPKPVALIDWPPQISMAFAVPLPLLGRRIMAAGALKYHFVEDIMENDGPSYFGEPEPEGSGWSGPYRNNQHRRKLQSFVSLSLSPNPWLTLALHGGLGSIDTKGIFNVTLGAGTENQLKMQSASSLDLSDRELGFSTKFRDDDRASLFAAILRVYSGGTISRRQDNNSAHHWTWEKDYSSVRSTLRFGGTVQLWKHAILTLIFERDSYSGEVSGARVYTNDLEEPETNVLRGADDWWSSAATAGLVKKFSTGSSLWLAVRSSTNRGGNAFPSNTNDPVFPRGWHEEEHRRTDIPIGVVYCPKGKLGEWLDLRLGLKGQVVSESHEGRPDEWSIPDEYDLEANFGLGLFPSGKVQGYIYFYNLRGNLSDRVAPPLASLGLGVNL